MSAPRQPDARRTQRDLPPEQRAALGDLVEAAHRLNLAVVTTDVDLGELVRVRDLLDEAALALTRQTRGRGVRADFEAAGRALESHRPYRMCALNPWGIPFEIEFDGDGAHASLMANALHEGPADSLHGGVGAWLMDCMLGLLLQARGHRAVTARIEIDYLARTPLDQALQLHSRITGREGRKIHAEGWIEHLGDRSLRATGLFIEVDRSVRP